MPEFLYTGALNFYTDDYKRPEGYTSLEGAFDTKFAAVAAMVTKAFQQNAARYENCDVSPEQKERADEITARYKKYAKATRDVIKLRKPSEKNLKRVIDQHALAMEEFLGESEFGVMSSGARPEWKRVRVLDQTTVLAGCKAFWKKFDENDGLVEYENRNDPLFGEEEEEEN